jgi:protein-S-isoprenylcysteine O-methyltransferase Ste14
MPRIPPPILTLAFAVAMWFAGDGGRSVVQVVAACAAFLLAGIFAFPAVRAFRRAGTTVDPVQVDRASAVVTGGIYRVTRNPMYVGLTLLLVAWALWLGGWRVWLGPVALLLWLDRFQIRPEEKAMEARFGEEYLRYKAQVRRWL